jgi:hypothetical protein
VKAAGAVTGMAVQINVPIGTLSHLGPRCKH